jgi:carbonic anhydrase/acetyltransferase-like protein (isoleucine patch superfamily)
MRVDEHREALGFLSVDATDALGERGVRVLDPSSALISKTAVLGAGTVVYPTVVVDTDERSSIVIGERCVLYPGSLLEARDGGRIAISDHAELGPGGVLIRVGRDGAIVLEEEVRLSGGCELTGVCELGRGAQILGAVSARSVRLGGGRGGHRWPVADERGAVLKGAGIADRVRLECGEVKSHRASFADAPVERQSAYHPHAR